MSNVNSSLLRYGVTDHPIAVAMNKDRPPTSPKVFYQPRIDRSRYPGWVLRAIRRQTHNHVGEIRR
jgi:hypothetical protein